MSHELWVLLWETLAAGVALGGLFAWFAISDIRKVMRGADARRKALEMRKAEHE